MDKSSEHTALTVKRNLDLTPHYSVNILTFNCLEWSISNLGAIAAGILRYLFTSFYFIYFL